MHYLVVTNDEDDVDLHGPFDTIREAQDYAERYRAMLELPIEATPENNEEWTERGWYFGIFAPRLLPQFQGRGGGQMGGQLTVSQTDKTTTRDTFTPGPWSVMRTATGIPVVVSQDEHIADVNGTNDANARLIAAAPDMYEALIAAQKHLDEARETVGSDLDQLADQVADALDHTQRGG